MCTFDMFQEELDRVVKARCHVLRHIVLVCTSDMLDEELGRVVNARCCVLKHILGVYI